MNGRTQIDLPANEAVKVISNVILGYLRDGKKPREAVLLTFHELGVNIPEERIEWLVKYYEKEIERLQTALDEGKHVANGQVIDLVKDAEELPK